MSQAYTPGPQAAANRGKGKSFLVIAALAAVVFGGGAWYLWSSSHELGLDDSPIFEVRREGDAMQVRDAQGQDLSEKGEAAETPAEAAEDARQAVERVEQVVEQQGGLDARVAAMEQRLTRLDLQAQAAAGNAARAEGLLIAFAARRALERGAPLGFLADQLRLRFGDAQPNAVQTVIDAAQDPVTLDQLLARLDGIADRLTQSPADEGVLQWMRRELGQMFIVRREDTPSPVAQRRLERARLFLQSGRTEAAVAEVRNLPNAIEALDWIADAERFGAAQRALELLETSAVLERQKLRDGDGELVETSGPTGG